ncbi:MAG: hypothetical protein R3E12_13145 [Candidatus Eisenbacteria bacterium]
MKSNGTTTRVTSASLTLSQKSTTVIPISVMMSPKADTIPEVKSWFSASTSEVRRVIVRPTGLRSK